MLVLLFGSIFICFICLQCICFSYTQTYIYIYTHILYICVCVLNINTHTTRMYSSALPSAAMEVHKYSDMRQIYKKQKPTCGYSSSGKAQLNHRADCHTWLLAFETKHCSKASHWPSWGQIHLDKERSFIPSHSCQRWANRYYAKDSWELSRDRGGVRTPVLPSSQVAFALCSVEVMELLF